jgi:hypothetical protein
MSLTKSSLGGNNDVIHELFLPRESLVSVIPAGDENIENLFFTVWFSQSLATIADKLTYKCRQKQEQELMKEDDGVGPWILIYIYAQEAHIMYLTVVS